MKAIKNYNDIRKGMFIKVEHPAYPNSFWIYFVESLNVKNDSYGTVRLLMLYSLTKGKYDLEPTERRYNRDENWSIVEKAWFDTALTGRTITDLNLGSDWETHPLLNHLK